MNALPVKVVDDLTALEERVLRLFLGINVRRRGINEISELFRHEYENPVVAAKCVIGDLWRRLHNEPRYASLEFPDSAVKWANAGLVAKRRK